jgi:phospho-N-acetylmuramoyl-pentapeptide-transferase
VRTLLTAGGLSLAFSLFLTPLFVRLFQRLELGQFIRDDGPQSHHAKRGTPTMGGIVFILATLFGVFVSALMFGGDGISPSSMLVLLMFVGQGVVGFIDDFIKVRNQRSLGLGGWAKIAGQVVVATLFAVLAIQFPNREGYTPASLGISAVRDVPALDIAKIATAVPAIAILLYLIWINLLATATTNGVNVTDGLDGLATGATILAIGSFLFIGFWQFNQSCFSETIEQANLGSATRRTSRSRSRSWPPRSPGRWSGSCGGTPTRRRSSWATPVPSPSAGRCAPSRCSPTPSCCSCSSAACSSSRPARSSCSGRTSRSRTASASSA